jgi:hypothetical protein
MDSGGRAIPLGRQTNARVQKLGLVREDIVIMNLARLTALRSRVSARSAAMALAGVGAILLILWSARQARLTDEALARAIAAEGAAARAQHGVDRSRAVENAHVAIKGDSQIVRSSHRATKADAERARQLSDEIAGLTEIKEKIDRDLYELQAKAARDAKNPRPSYPLP